MDISSLPTIISNSININNQFQTMVINNQFQTMVILLNLRINRLRINTALSIKNFLKQNWRLKLNINPHSQFSTQHLYRPRNYKTKFKKKIIAYLHRYRTTHIKNFNHAFHLCFIDFSKKNR
ncbi:hypothetical protein MANES_12G085516v8 [Manihot esculenta]|uniref:Uncharacterized protein n=1 Tax=Manihot esculenta TaxID=3983 RepID=A0ACB7GR24_MANES|nr:hypothetical protein MANES_12G085516v8 [Manihot esculenta]